MVGHFFFFFPFPFNQLRRTVGKASANDERVSDDGNARPSRFDTRRPRLHARLIQFIVDKLILTRFLRYVLPFPKPPCTIQ